MSNNKKVTSSILNCGDLQMHFGFTEAAEWAIQRSLSQMKQAEKDKAGAPSGEDEDEV